jgi:hypothetical protein
MSVLHGCYTGSPETAFDFDIRPMEARGLARYPRIRHRERAPRELLGRDCCRSSWSRDITGLDLLKAQGLSHGRYHQIANFVLAQIAIGDAPPDSLGGSSALDGWANVMPGDSAIQILSRCDARAFCSLSR